MEFQSFPKMARLYREAVITEKIDGTNAQVCITEDGEILAGSRTRWITPEDDNFGFAAWVRDNKEELLQLGPGRHFGEWWGQGIQRKYGLDHKRFSLFNVLRWHQHDQEPQPIYSADPRIGVRYTSPAPACCHVVPVLRRGEFNMQCADCCLNDLRDHGSLAAPGFVDPEGVVVYHVAGNVGFKATIKNDDQPKSK